MIKLKGTSLYPQGIFEVLQQTDHVKDYVVEVFTGSLGTDELKLYILTPEEHSITIQSGLKSAFQSHLKVTPEIVFTTSAEMEVKTP